MVGGMTMIELLAYAMRSVCGRIAAEEMRGVRNVECDYIRNVRLVSYWVFEAVAEGEGFGCENGCCVAS